MDRRSIILFATGLIAAGALAWVAESCSSHAQASNHNEPIDEETSAEVDTAATMSAAGPFIDKTCDTVLTQMREEIMPQFKCLSYTDVATGRKMEYTLFYPRRITKGVEYPMVLFMADATTAGPDVMRPVSQGYGAMVWATLADQAKHPSYILVPQFSGVAVNDACKVTAEADVLERLIAKVIKDNQVDASRIYATGQGMGGMLAMHLNIQCPKLFAASVFVDSHWDETALPKLADKRFVYITAGDRGRSYATASSLASIMREKGRSTATKEWSARLSIAEQNRLAADLLSQGRSGNFITFSNGTTLPEDGNGSEQLYAYDKAFQLTSVRNWLFEQHR